MLIIISLAILILSIVLHELAHGYAANWLGDPTARLQGRLTLNPLVHIDPMGSVIIPALLFMSGAQFLFGYAKPVPYNPYNLNNQKWGESIVAAAGPLANLLIAFIFALIIRLNEVLNLSAGFLEIASYVVFINILLALFNAIPFPPLDGSKIIPPFLPFGLAYKYKMFTQYMENLGLIALFGCVFIFIYILWGPFSHVVEALYQLFVGI